MTQNRESSAGIVVVIPAYNPPQRFKQLLQEVAAEGLPILVVDDGSDRLEIENIQVMLLKHARRMGKGVALRSGFDLARQKGFQWAITMDADFQHLPKDLFRFINAIKQEKADIVIGNRFHGGNRVPKARLHANRVSSRLLSQLIGFPVKDGQSGFRAYKLSLFEDIAPRFNDFSFETEVIIMAVMRGYVLDFVDITVVYYAGQQARSSFRPVCDTTIISLKSLYRILTERIRRLRKGGPA